MQNTDARYKAIVESESYYVETSLCIAESDSTDTPNPDNGIREDKLLSLTQSRAVFSSNNPGVGACISGEINVQMLPTGREIPRKAKLSVFARVVSKEDETDYSDWLPKGVFYVDTRETTNNNDGLDITTIHGYDAMLMAEQLYSAENIEFPAKAKTVAMDIANKMGVNINATTLAILSTTYDVQVPIEYTCREILGYIGAMHGGNWVMDDFGELRLIRLGDIPQETYYLLDDLDNRITFGGFRIVLEGS